jgi:hypothetical protein
MTDFAIHASPGSDWLIGFTDRNGRSRLLPTKKKWFGYWKTTNCPTEARYLNSFNPTATDGKTVVVSTGLEEDLSPEEALRSFKEKFASVEEYLGSLND